VATRELNGKVQPAPGLAGSAHDTTARPAGSAAAAPALSGGLASPTPAGGVLAGGGVLGGGIHHDKRPQGAAAAVATLLGGLALQPASQSVFLEFRLDRTLVPYTAERG
jgi:hypothetical protein